MDLLIVLIILTVLPSFLLMSYKEFSGFFVGLYFIVIVGFEMMWEWVFDDY